MTTKPPALCDACQARKDAAAETVSIARPPFPLGKTRRHEIRLATWTACLSCTARGVS
jgi:hypothetical protein